MTNGNSLPQGGEAEQPFVPIRADYGWDGISTEEIGPAAQIHAGTAEYIYAGDFVDHLDTKLDSWANHPSQGDVVAPKVTIDAPRASDIVTDHHKEQIA